MHTQEKIAELYKALGIIHKLVAIVELNDTEEFGHLKRTDSAIKHCIKYYRSSNAVEKRR